MSTCVVFAICGVFFLNVTQKELQNFCPMLDNEVPSVIRIMWPEHKEHREHIKYEAIKYLSPIEKSSSSVWGRLSFHRKLVKGHLGLHGPYSREDQGAKVTWEPHEICTWGYLHKDLRLPLWEKQGDLGKWRPLPKQRWDWRRDYAKPCFVGLRTYRTRHLPGSLLMAKTVGCPP